MEGPNRQKNGQFSSRKYTRKSRKTFAESETPTDNAANISWSDGRRIVKLGYIASQLTECQRCKIQPLHLVDCVNEIRYGFGSILKIKCNGCKYINSIYTGKQHRESEKKDKGMKIFDINTKSALDKAKSRIDRKKNRYRVNAKEDVTLLQQLITSVNPTTDDILCFSFSVKYVQEYL
jgi:phage FluMu protein Com